MAQNSTRPSLLARLRDWDDEDAWRDFNATYRSLILRYCSKRGLQASDAEDVRQAVLLRLVQSLQSFDYSPQKGRFRDYLGRVVKNSIHRHFRRQNREFPGLDHMAECSAVDSDPSSLWEREWVLHHYRLALESARKSSEPKSIRVFERLLDGEPPESVANDFGMSRDAVYKIKQRVKEALQQSVLKQISDEQLPLDRRRRSPE